MSEATTTFGEIDGQTVFEHRIANEGIAARILSYGAILRDVRIETTDDDVPVVLGCQRIEDYLPKSYVGAIVGRYANRIGGARFTLDGTEYPLVPNEGENQLHGGPAGFSMQHWHIAEAGPTRLALEYISPDGEMGYPGRLVARTIYETHAPYRLRITTEAETDRATPANIVSHAYYNLDGGGDVRDHLLSIRANRVTPVDADRIPSGALRDVQGTPYDLRARRRIRDRGIDFDINYVVDPADNDVVSEEFDGALFRAAVLKGARSGIQMELWTTEPGLQFYDGARLGAPFGAHAGLCLEAQRFPDAPNHPNFPDAILRPGDTLRQVVELRFQC